jgi:predicted HTH domain antitoxin
MQVVLDIPDTIAAQLTAAGKSPARAALEALAVEGYRTGQLFEYDLREMLGYEVPMQVHALLSEHGVPLNYSAADLQQDIDTLRNLSPAGINSELLILSHNP